MANAATGRFLARFPECAVPGRPNAMRLLFHPQGLRPFVEDWEGVAGIMIQRLHREVAGAQSGAETQELLEELLGYAGVPSRWRRPELDRPPAPLVAVSYRREGIRLSFFSTITTFGTPQDVTLQELRIESFFAADESTRAALMAG